MLTTALLLFAAMPDPEAVRREIVARCGIAADRLVTGYEGEPPEGTIALNGDGPLSDGQIDCFGKVITETGMIIFTIEDEAIGERYETRRQTGMVADARAVLASRGLLRRLPVYNPRRGLAGFAKRLERLCGAAPGSLLKVEGDNIVLIIVPREPISDAQFERESCAISAVIASGFNPFGGPPPIVTITPAS